MKELCGWGGRRPKGGYLQCHVRPEIERWANNLCVLRLESDINREEGLGSETEEVLLQGAL